MGYLWLRWSSSKHTQPKDKVALSGTYMSKFSRTWLIEKQGQIMTVEKHRQEFKEQNNSDYWQLCTRNSPQL